MTVVLAFADFERFLAARGNPVKYVTVSNAALNP